jgi:hypothetical protein
MNQNTAARMVDPGWLLEDLAGMGVLERGQATPAVLLSIQQAFPSQQTPEVALFSGGMKIAS